MSLYDKKSIVQLLTECPLCGCKLTKAIRSERNIFPKHVHVEVYEFTNTWSHLIKCMTCEFAFVQEIPISPTFFKNRYDNEWFDPEEEVRSFRKNTILDDLFFNLNKFNTPKGKLLDVGSFAGKLLFFAKEQGYDPEGIEVNPKLAKFSHDKLGFKVYSGEIMDVKLPETYFLVVTIIDVLEHLVNPKKVLQNIERSLVKDGILYIKVPNYPMQIIKQNIANFFGISKAGMCENYGHINHFNVKSMKIILNHLGFILEEVQIAKSEQWRSDKSFWRIRNLIRLMFWKITTIAFKIGGPCLGLNLVFIARKK